MAGHVKCARFSPYVMKIAQASCAREGLFSTLDRRRDGVVGIVGVVGCDGGSLANVGAVMSSRTVQLVLTKYEWFYTHFSLFTFRIVGNFAMTQMTAMPKHPNFRSTDFNLALLLQIFTSNVVI